LSLIALDFITLLGEGVIVSVAGFGFLSNASELQPEIKAMKMINKSDLRIIITSILWLC